MVSNFKTIILRLKWMFMSPEARYVYLWNRTKAGSQAAYPSRHGKYS